MGGYLRVDENTHHFMKIEAARRRVSLGELVRIAVASLGQSDQENPAHHSAHIGELP